MGMIPRSHHLQVNFRTISIYIVYEPSRQTLPLPPLVTILLPTSFEDYTLSIHLSQASSSNEYLCLQFFYNEMVFYWHHSVSWSSHVCPLPSHECDDYPFKLGLCVRLTFGRSLFDEPVHSHPGAETHSPESKSLPLPLHPSPSM